MGVIALLFIGVPWYIIAVRFQLLGGAAVVVGLFWAGWSGGVAGVPVCIVVPGD